MRISDWSSDVCSADLGAVCLAIHASAPRRQAPQGLRGKNQGPGEAATPRGQAARKDNRADCGPGPSSRLIPECGPSLESRLLLELDAARRRDPRSGNRAAHRCRFRQLQVLRRSEEHTSELQSLMRISYAVFCLKKKKK